MLSKIKILTMQCYFLCSLSMTLSHKRHFLKGVSGIVHFAAAHHSHLAVPAPCVPLHVRARLPPCLLSTIRVSGPGLSYNHEP